MQYIYLFINIYLLNNFIALGTARKEKKNDFMLIMNIYKLIMNIYMLIMNIYMLIINLF